MSDPTTIAQQLQDLRQAMATACASVGRNVDEVQLLAVSKTQSADAVNAAVIAGQRHFGENYVQDALGKMDHVVGEVVWHFIGPLQSNKTRAVAEHFDWVHTVDRLKIAERLSAQRPAGRAALNICLQINISRETAKSGVAPEQVMPLAERLVELPNLRLRGLMAIAEDTSDTSKLRAQFGEMQTLMARLQDAGMPLDTLSMGMSQDWRLAIEFGATIIRVGTAVFGPRQPRPPSTEH